VLQGVFRNPLVDPHVIGVSSGAAFGGVLAILLGLGAAVLWVMAFGFGIGALLLVVVMSRKSGRSSLLMLVLAGIVVSALFSALVSLGTYFADPNDTLPAIVFWLMGSFASATPERALYMVPLVMLFAVPLLLMRFRINVLSLGDEDARALGLKVEPTRWLALCCVTGITAASVANSGIIGWVGLVIPHFARTLVGPDHGRLLPAAALLGAIFMLLVDTLARTMIAAEIPLGVLTAIVGAPVFLILLHRNRGDAW
jgi:iron complex transport system permease protein